MEAKEDGDDVGYYHPDDVNALSSIELFEQLINQLFYRTILQSLASPSPVVTFTDFSRSIAFLHVAIRLWIIQHNSMERLKESMVREKENRVKSIAYIA